MAAGNPGTAQLSPHLVHDIPWPGWLEIDEITKTHPAPTLNDFRTLSAADYGAMLEPAERQWAHIQPWLQSKGYLLRPRFRPGWKPSWPNGAAAYKVQSCEDSVRHNRHARSIVMDATRISDGRRVLLKRFELPADGRTELAINTMLSSDPLSRDPRNPALQMLDVLSAPNHCFMVFPLGQSLLHTVDTLDTVGEGIDIVEQTLKGLVFLHENGIAHRDCAASNIVMDSSRIYPRGLHLDSSIFDTRGREIGHLRTRTQVGGVKYYFIDFGESIRFGPGDSTRITVDSKASISAPETLDESFWPYDAFKPDIYTLGTMYRKTLVKVYTSFDALEPLIEAMTDPNPDNRPTAPEALAQFETIQSSFSRTELHARLHKRIRPPESPRKRFIRDFLHYSEQIAWAIQNWKW